MNAQPDTSAMQVDAGFNIPCPTTVPSLKGKVSDAEWTLRLQLAATYRLCAMHGWTDQICPTMHGTEPVSRCQL